jgi:hypothetical protein
MTEKDLINYNTILNNAVDEALVTTMMNEATNDKEEPEANTLANTIMTFNSDFSSHTTRTGAIMTKTTKTQDNIERVNEKTENDETTRRITSFGSTSLYYTQLLSGQHHTGRKHLGNNARLGTSL